MRLLSLLSILVLGACSAAGGSDSAECAQGSDCPSGVCSAAGQCVSAEGPGGSAGAAGSEAGGGGQGGSGGSAGEGQAGAAGNGSSGSAGAGAGGSKLCSPDNDGTVTRAETPLLAGAKVTHRLAQNAPVDTAGKGEDPKNKAWDFTAELAGDHSVLIETQPLDGKWFSSKFAGASYALRLSDSEDLLGVFEANDTALLLRGVVSPSDGNSRTELVYTPPVTVLAFPMKLGSSWSTQSTITGVTPLTPGGFSTAVNYFENYQSKVDEAGTVKTPYGEFPALRVNLLLTRTVGALVTSSRTFTFSAECYGTIAKIVSPTATFPAAPGEEFSTAAELTRLSP